MDRSSGDRRGAVLLALQGWLWFELLRRYGRALRRIAELESGIDEPPSLEAGHKDASCSTLPDLDGQLVSLESLLEESEETILLFTNPGCGACDLVLADPAAGGLVVVSGGVVDRELHGGTVLLDEEREVMRLYGVTVVPTAVFVDRHGCSSQARRLSEPANSPSSCALRPQCVSQEKRHERVSRDTSRRRRPRNPPSAHGAEPGAPPAAQKLAHALPRGLWMETEPKLRLAVVDPAVLDGVRGSAAPTGCCGDESTQSTRTGASPRGTYSRRLIC